MILWHTPMSQTALDKPNNMPVTSLNIEDLRPQGTTLPKASTAGALPQRGEHHPPANTPT